MSDEPCARCQHLMAAHMSPSATDREAVAEVAANGGEATLPDRIRFTPCEDCGCTIAVEEER